jgi:Lar family restriction alleviation protein
MTNNKTLTERVALLPCPFCNDEPVMADPHGAFSRLAAVYCEQCEIKGPLKATATDAAEAWNTRAAMPQQPPVDGWRAIDHPDTPHACHVLAARFDDTFGEWIYGVVASPPPKPFTHWQPLPAPPGSTPSEQPPASDERVEALEAALKHIRELLVAYGSRYIGKAVMLADAALTKEQSRPVGDE